MDLGLPSGLVENMMEIDMRGSLKMGKFMGREFTFGKVEKGMKVNSFQEKQGGRVTKYYGNGSWLEGEYENGQHVGKSIMHYSDGRTEE